MKTLRTFLALACLAVIGLPAFAQGDNSLSLLSRVAGIYDAKGYSKWQGQITGPTVPAGTNVVLTVFSATMALRDGKSMVPFSTTIPITISGDNGTSASTETVTPSSVSNCTLNDTRQNVCQITVTTTLNHGQGNVIVTGSGGLGEAVYDAWYHGGGTVVVDGASPVTTANIIAQVPFGNVVIEDLRSAAPQFWTASQATATIPAAPATRTAVTVGFGLNGANTTGGTYTGTSTYNVNVACVDIMGNEGNASATFSGLTAGTGSTNQIGFAAPTCTGAQEVGYIPYISLASGTYNLSYQVPVTSAVCTLTKLETTTPACATANTTYGQAASNAVVSALTVNTAPLHLLVTTASTTAAYIGTPSNRATYVYSPHNSVGAPGFTTSQQAYTIAVAAASTVPEVIGTIPIPNGAMNYAGRTIRICGQATMATAGTTATVQNIEFLWDAAGSNTTGAPVIIGQLQITATGAGSLAENYGFCENFQTTVSGAGVTAGSIMPLSGLLNYVEGAGTIHAAGTDVLAAAVGSLNLAGTGGNTQRIHIVWLHSTGTDANGMTLSGLTVEVI